MLDANKPVRLAIDHTGLHSAGLCLLGRARSETDVNGLLQFATLLIFSDEILISKVETPTVVERSREIQGEVLQYFADPKALQLVGDVATYKKACQEAARTAAYNLEIGFQPSQHSLKELAPTTLGDWEREYLKSFHRMLTDDCQYDQFLSRAERDGVTSPDAIIYMIACSPNLRRIIKDLGRVDDGWTDSRVMMLESYLRFYLNEEHHGRLEASYVPAVARADLIKEVNYFVADRICALHKDKVLQDMFEMVESVVEKLRGRRLGMPAFAAALVQKSAGDPAGILVEARRMRDAAQPLREWIQDAWARLLNGSGDKLTQSFTELRWELEFRLGLNRQNMIRDIAEAISVMLLPSANPIASIGKILQLYRYGSSAKTAVLTDVSVTATRMQTYQNYRRLVRAATKNSRG